MSCVQYYYVINHFMEKLLNMQLYQLVFLLLLTPTLSSFHQVFLKLKTRLTLPGYGASERIDPPWTMTSWAGRYVSTTRRGSSASPTCLRDWSTSSCTRCETVDRWEVRRKEQPAEQTIQMPRFESTRAWHDHSSRNTCWPTLLVHISAPRGGRDVWILICACAHEKETRQCYCWGGERGHPMSCLLCFPAAEWNNTNPKKKNHNKDKCTVFTFAWSASTFLFPSPWCSNIPPCPFPRKHFFCPHLFSFCSFGLHLCFCSSHTCG